MKMKICAGIAMFGLVFPALGGAIQETQKEHYPSGKLKAEFNLDEEGRKHGKYVEYFESGKKKISGAFEHGAKQGEWSEYYESGKPFGKKSYAKGAVAGDILRTGESGFLLYRARVLKGTVQVCRDLKTPEAAYGRSLEEIRKRISAIDPPKQRREFFEPDRCVAEPSSRAPYKLGRLKPEYMADALKHLNVYRYLGGVDPGVKLDETMNDHCQHAAVVCAANGRVSHTPAKPEGMNEAFFAKGYKGAASSNLSHVALGLRGSLDGLMADATSNNLAHVGHRGWILNPEMGKTGFGECDGIVAHWSQDRSGKPDRQDLIAYPTCGFHPVEYFTVADAPWSVTTREGRFKLPPEPELLVRMWLLDEEYDFAEELEVNHKSVAKEFGAVPRAVFRPAIQKKHDWENRRVWVLIHKAGVPAFGYLVHFVKLDSGEGEKEPPK